MNLSIQSSKLLRSGCWPIFFALCGIFFAKAAQGETLTLTPIADAAGMEQFPTNNFGASLNIPGGGNAHVTTSGNAFRCRDFIRFDLSGLPAGAQVTSATLTLNVSMVPFGAVTAPFSLHRLLRSWTEGSRQGRLGSEGQAGESTWLSAGQSAWGTPGGAEGTDYATDSSSIATLAGLGKYTFPSGTEMLADVQAWQEHPDQNFGWLLKCDQETIPQTAKRIDTRENLTAANRPTLTIEYSVQVGVGLQIGEPSSTATKGGPITYTVTYANASTISLTELDVALNKTGAANGSVAVSGSGDTRLVTISAITGDGTLGISIAAGTASGANGSTAPAAGPSTTFLVDNTPPPVPIISGIVTDTGVSSTDGLTDDPTLNITGTAEANSGITLQRGDIGVIGTTAADGSGHWTFDYSGTILPEGNYDFTAMATDAVGNPSAASPALAVTVDLAAPTLAISEPSAAITKSGPVSFTVTYLGQNDISLNAGAIILNPTGTPTGSVAVNGTGNTRTVTISGVSGDGSLGISIAAGTASDAAGNLAGAVGPSATFVVDNTPPTVPAITGITSDTGSSGNDGITSDTTLAISGVAEANSTVTVKRADKGTIGTAHADAQGNWSFDYTSTVLAEGQYAFTATASDAVGNESPVSSTFNVTVDTTAPTLAISAPSAATTKSGPVSFTVTYSGQESISLSPEDILLNSLGNVTGSLAVTGSGDTRTVTISGINGDGTISITIGGGTARDLAGNLTATGGPSASFNVDSTAPAAPVITGINSDSSAPNDGITSDNTLLILGTAEASSTVRVRREDIGVIGNTIADASGNWTFDYTGTILSEGNYTFTATAADGVGNESSQSAAFPLLVDTTAPTITIGSPSANVTKSGPVSFSVTYSGESTISLSPADVKLNAVGNATGSIAVSGSGDSRTVTISEITGDGALGISIRAGTASDVAGNLAPAAADSATFIVDNTNDAPEIIGTIAGQPVDDNASVLVFNDSLIRDADLPAQTLTITVALDDPAKGKFTDLGGFVDKGGGKYEFTGTAADATPTFQNLKFVPTSNRVAVGSKETTTITVAVSDGNGGEATDNRTTVISTSINNPPIAADDSVTRIAGQDITIPIAELLKNDSDVDVDDTNLVVTLPNARSANGAPIKVEGSTIVYSATANNEVDSFTYAVSDPHGGIATAKVTVLVEEERIVLTIIREGSDFIIRFNGTAGRRYAVQSASDVASQNWTDLGDANFAANGTFEFRDANPDADVKFYRVLAH
jgi:hypothetical protein